MQLNNCNNILLVLQSEVQEIQLFSNEQRFLIYGEDIAPRSHPFIMEGATAPRPSNIYTPVNDKPVQTTVKDGSFQNIFPFA